MKAARKDKLGGFERTKARVWLGIQAGRGQVPEGCTGLTKECRLWSESNGRHPTVVNRQETWVNVRL